ncbi:MAG: TolC family protein [Oscillospiraceae bacterium]
MMKYGISLLLVLVLAAGIAFPAYAQDTDQAVVQKQTVEVSLDSIEDIMLMYNLDIKTYLNNLKIARDNAEDYEDTDYEDYYDNQYDIAKVQYDENAGNMILNAKQSYLAYCADNDRYLAMQAAAQKAQKEYSVALAALSSGFVSQAYCDNLKDQYNQAQNNLTQLDQQLTRERNSLRTLLNLPSNVNMSIRPVTEDDIDFSDIPSINYGADLIEMRKHDPVIEQEQLAYEYQQTLDDNTYELKNAYIALQKAKESQEAAFKELYDNLTSMYTVYQQNVEQVQRKQKELEVEKQALSLGYSSQKAVDEKENELKTLQSTLADSRKNLFVSYLSYINMKNGFTTGS